MTRILVIEDEQILLDEILDVLRFEEYEVVGAPNGIAGFELARQRPPDLIICDIVMPGLDGYGVLQLLRRESTTMTIPFVFLTAKAEKTDRRTGMELGADDYLTKPFTHDELLAAIHTQIQKHVAHVDLAEQRMQSLRTQVLTSLPHELRTPLVSLLGYSELLMEENSPIAPDQIAQIGRIMNHSAMRLYHLIENYLTYIEIELIGQDAEWRARLMEMGTVDPASIVEENARAVACKADRESDLILNIGELPAVRIDPHYLMKIIEELVDNAFKFSRPGMPVSITALHDERTCTIRIADQGRGMTAQQINQVGAYMQFERKMYEQQGSGMGLIIAKKLVELHDGQFALESLPGRGTVVQLQFPY